MTYISSCKYARNNSFKQKRLPICKSNSIGHFLTKKRKLKAVLNQIRASQNEPVDIPLNYLGKPVCMWLRTNKYEESCSWNTLLYTCLCIGYGNSHLVESTTAENKRRVFSRRLLYLTIQMVCRPQSTKRALYLIYTLYFDCL